MFDLYRQGAFGGHEDHGILRTEIRNETYIDGPTSMTCCALTYLGKISEEETIAQACVFMCAYGEMENSLWCETDAGQRQFFNADIEPEDVRSRVQRVIEVVYFDSMFL